MFIDVNYKFIPVEDFLNFADLDLTFFFFLVPLAFQKQRIDSYVSFDLALKILNERYKL